MKESHYRKFMLGIYLVMVGIFGWVFVEDSDERLKIALAAAVFTAGFFWVLQVSCRITRQAGGFSAAPAPESIKGKDTA